MEQCDATALPNKLFQLLYLLCLFVLKMNRWSIVMLLLHQMWCFSCSTVCVCLYWRRTDGAMWCYCFTKCAVSVAVPPVFVCTEDEQMEQCDATALPNKLFQLLYRLCLFVLRMNRWSNVMLLLHQISCFSCCTVCVCLYEGWRDAKFWSSSSSSDKSPSEIGD
jgi:hypothetical protein